MKVELAAETIGLSSFVGGLVLEVGFDVHPEGLKVAAAGFGLFVVGAIAEHISARKQQ